MKKITSKELGALLFAGLMALPLTAFAADRYKVDKDHASIMFRVMHFNFAWTWGRFRQFDGEFTVDKNNPRSSSVSFTIDAASVYTNVAKRDKHLKSPDFFNVKQFPKITFKSKSVRKAGKGYAIKGDLTMHGVTRTVTLKMTKVGEGKDPWGNHRMGFDGGMTLKRSDFGMKKMIGPAGDKVEIVLALEGIKQ